MFILERLVEREFQFPKSSSPGNSFPSEFVIDCNYISYKSGKLKDLAKRETFSHRSKILGWGNEANGLWYR